MLPFLLDRNIAFWYIGVPFLKIKSPYYINTYFKTNTGCNWMSMRNKSSLFMMIAYRNCPYSKWAFNYYQELMNTLEQLLLKISEFLIEYLLVYCWNFVFLGRLLKSFQIDFNWYHLASWVNITEQWPYRTTCLILYHDAHEETLDDSMTLKAVYDKYVI